MRNSANTKLRIKTGVVIVGALLLWSGALSARADERAATKRFEAAKKDEPSLIAFLKAMPKGGDLHVHAGGALYAEYLLDNALRNKLFYDPKTNQFNVKDGQGRIPAAKLLEGEAGDNLERFLDAASMRGYHPGTESGHDHFFRSFGPAGSAANGLPAGDEDVEIISRARAQNEQYLELMTRVGPDEAYAALRDPPAVDDPAAALTQIAPRLQQFVRLCRAYLDDRDKSIAARLGMTTPLTGAQNPITVRYIVAASRLASDSDFFARLAAGMALMQADKRVVGVNILAPEDHPFARAHFDMQMRLLDVLWKHFNHPNITLHAGELTLAISPMEPMQSRIRRSIEVGHARRIGHGVSIAWEDDLPGLLRNMKQDGVAVEICLTSNDAILNVSGDRHPFLLYRKAGVPVSLNTDDEGVNRSVLTMEFVRAARAYNLLYADLKELARNSLEYAFVPGDSLFVDHRYRHIRPEFAGINKPGWKPDAAAQRLLTASEKMQVQARLEQAFAAFEHGPFAAESRP